MQTIIMDSTDPFFNLALEEYLLKEYPLKEDLFFLWQNDKSVIIGRNQNPYNEIDLTYCHKNNIPVLRRSSGGGAVYHDLGNINFTYLTNSLKYLNNYEAFLQPIMALLNQIGLKVTFKPKSHLYLENKKISGNAQAYHKERMLHHGTLLYDMDLEVASLVLRRKNIKGHHVLSTPASICNIKNKTPIVSTAKDFMDYIREGVLLTSSCKKITLTEKDIKRIHEIKSEKFESFSWIYGTNTSFTILDTGFYLKAQNGVITESSLEQLVGVKAQYKDVESTLMELPNKQDILSKIF